MHMTEIEQEFFDSTYWKDLFNVLKPTFDQEGLLLNGIKELSNDICICLNTVGNIYPEQSMNLIEKKNEEGLLYFNYWQPKGCVKDYRIQLYLNKDKYLKAKIKDKIQNTLLYKKLSYIFFDNEPKEITQIADLIILRYENVMTNTLTELDRKIKPVYSYNYTRNFFEIEKGGKLKLTFKEETFLTYDQEKSYAELLQDIKNKKLEDSLLSTIGRHDLKNVKNIVEKVEQIKDREEKNKYIDACHKEIEGSIFPPMKKIDFKTTSIPVNKNWRT
jgi:hypothetical protein